MAFRRPLLEMSVKVMKGAVMANNSGLAIAWTRSQVILTGQRPTEQRSGRQSRGWKHAPGLLWACWLSHRVHCNPCCTLWSIWVPWILKGSRKQKPFVVRSELFEFWNCILETTCSDSGLPWTNFSMRSALGCQARRGPAITDASCLGSFQDQHQLHIRFLMSSTNALHLSCLAAFGGLSLTWSNCHLVYMMNWLQLFSVNFQVAWPLVRLILFIC